jgi:hypothetical protein
MFLPFFISLHPFQHSAPISFPFEVCQV